ncbi:hypothetical protein [Pseudovibrio brasiliensis]|uniref:Uncharacterized protein n=1 Tax=Pseudovibrio brasiliensis TaxID=1898042 RepID=A0ABX8AMR2_9HYPH|nr:hypothetical protein [Pseudovibrio brasiliensis]QUS56358.1 hypothetical protein KGB56_02590 [Pseudovibrio brasiliensis]
MSIKELLKTVYQEDMVTVASEKASATIFSFPEAKVRVNPDPPLVRALQSRMNELCALEKGWDGYGGQPVSHHRMSFGANLLGSICSENTPTPSLVPGSDGTVQIEWHENFCDIELDILDAFEVSVYCHDIKDNIEEEFDLSSDFSALAKWIQKLEENRA